MKSLNYLNIVIFKNFANVIFIVKDFFAYVKKGKKNGNLKQFVQSINFKSEKIKSKKTKLEFKGMWSLPQTLIFYNAHNC